MGLLLNQGFLTTLVGLVLNEGFDNRWAISIRGISAESEGFSNRWAIRKHGIRAESGLEQQMGD
jgi:hypothetical protein